MLVRPERMLGANDRVRVAICGLHGRGLNHLQNYSQIHNAEVTALCDIDENVLRQRVAQMQKMGLAKPATYVDIRKLLEDHSIDVLSIATPNHWHSLMAIWACQAGKEPTLRRAAAASQSWERAGSFSKLH